MVLKEIDPSDVQIWKPEKAGEKIAGTYIRLQENAGKFKSNAYHLETEEGKRVVVFGSTILDDKMRLVELKSKIEIVFDGIGEGKDNDFKKFRVFVDDGSKS